MYNDNHGCIDWSNSFSTKGMHYVNIRENAVCEARLLGGVSINHIPGTSNPADLFTKEFKSDSSLLGWGVSDSKIPKFLTTFKFETLSSFVQEVTLLALHF